MVPGGAEGPGEDVTNRPGKSLYTAEVHEECLGRIERLSPEAVPGWGRMTPAQMLAHCAEILEVANGKELRNTPFLARLFKGLIRRAVVGDKPFPRNARTHPQYRQTADRDFEAERQRLLAALDAFRNAGEDERRRPHPLFGEMTDDERGWSMYKHLDHHLGQFGV